MDFIFPPIFAYPVLEHKTRLLTSEFCDDCMSLWKTFTKHSFRHSINNGFLLFSVTSQTPKQPIHLSYCWRKWTKRQGRTWLNKLPINSRAHPLHISYMSFSWEPHPEKDSGNISKQWQLRTKPRGLVNYMCWNKLLKMTLNSIYMIHMKYSEEQRSSFPV